MKKKTRQQRHQFMNFVHFLVKYAKNGKNSKRRFACARILQNELGTTLPKVSLLNAKFNKIIGQVNEQNQSKV